MFWRPAGEEDVFVAVVIVVADGDAVEIAGASEAGVGGDVGEGAVAIVAVEAIGGVGEWVAEAGAREDENVEPAIVIVIDKRAAAGHGFDDVIAAGGVASDGWRGEAGVVGDVCELRVPGKAGGFGAGAARTPRDATSCGERRSGARARRLSSDRRCELGHGALVNHSILTQESRRWRATADFLYNWTCFAELEPEL